MTRAQGRRGPASSPSRKRRRQTRSWRLHSPERHASSRAGPAWRRVAPSWGAMPPAPGCRPVTSTTVGWISGEVWGEGRSSHSRDGRRCHAEPGLQHLLRGAPRRPGSRGRWAPRPPPAPPRRGSCQIREREREPGLKYAAGGRLPGEDPARPGPGARSARHRVGNGPVDHADPVPAKSRRRSGSGPVPVSGGKPSSQRDGGESSSTWIPTTSSHGRTHPGADLQRDAGAPRPLSLDWPVRSSGVRCWTSIRTTSAKAVWPAASFRAAASRRVRILAARASPASSGVPAPVAMASHLRCHRHDLRRPSGRSSPCPGSGRSLRPA
jgi:hypothetical protein